MSEKKKIRGFDPTDVKQVAATPLGGHAFSGEKYELALYPMDKDWRNGLCTKIFDLGKESKQIQVPYQDLRDLQSRMRNEVNEYKKMVQGRKRALVLRKTQLMKLKEEFKDDAMVSEYEFSEINEELEYLTLIDKEPIIAFQHKKWLTWGSYESYLSKPEKHMGYGDEMRFKMFKNQGALNLENSRIKERAAKPFPGGDEDEFFVNEFWVSA